MEARQRYGRIVEILDVIAAEASITNMEVSQSI